MSPFADVLRPLIERLDLPQSTRARVVLELAADLEDLYETYLEEGLDEAEARRRAAERFAPCEQVLEGLRRVHANPYRRMLDQLGDRAGSRVERAASGLLLLFVLLTSGPLLMSNQLFARASDVAVAVVALTVAALLLSAWKLYRLEIRQDHRPSRLRTGLSLLLGLAAGNVLLGAGGSWLDLYRTSVKASTGSEHFLRLLLDWGIRSSAMLVLAFTGAIVAAVLWFVLARRISSIEQAEAALLLEI